MKKKILALTLVFALALALGIGGTVAWLTAQTTPVVNTFTVGDINITLAETATDFKMVPGNKIAKDPKVTVRKDSEACWLFVKVEKSTNFETFMEYEMADGWTELPDNSGIYYREVAALTAANAVDTTFSVLSDNKVTVKNTVTKSDMNGLAEKNADGTPKKDNDGNLVYDDAKLPKLTFTAYAVQKDNIATAADAWAKVSTTSNP